MKFIAILILILLSGFGYAMSMPPELITPDSLFPVDATAEGICKVVWMKPFASNVRVLERIRVINYCIMRDQQLQELEELSKKIDEKN